MTFVRIWRVKIIFVHIVVRAHVDGDTLVDFSYDARDEYDLRPFG